MTPSQNNSHQKNSTPLRVLGVDTSLRSTGLGIVELVDGRIRGIAFDVVKVPQKKTLSQALFQLQTEINSVLDEFNPDVVAVEGVFFARYARSALLLGHARGVVMASVAARSLPMYEYEPRRVKQAVAGYGAASKGQIQQMVVSLLGINKVPPEDAADALAIAICHINSFLRPELSIAKTI